MMQPYIEGIDEPISLYRLRRTIGNSAINLDNFKDWFDSLPVNIIDQPGGISKQAIAQNYLERTRQSMKSLSTLLKSNEIYSPIQAIAQELSSDRISKNGR
jgi:hypothetical protein